jgi:2-succinyl-5-enolpyruvyl-6-hydroxy-3-cyclohexene-1-carboxylate synthase
VFPDKKNILQLASLMLQHGIRHVVLSPGSRNAPLIHTFVEHPDFECYTIVDERSAGFFAIGLSLSLKEPVAVCCTSGTALLNYGPAIAEAFYQQVPLLVISADRPAAWIGQQDGQTIPQNGIFDPITRKSVQLPEVTDKQEEWHCNRLINEALLSLALPTKGPVHINVPLSEPLYNFTVGQLPEARCIRPYFSGQKFNIQLFVDQWHATKRRLVVVGQLAPGHSLNNALCRLAAYSDTVIIAEHIGNLDVPAAIGNFDTLLGSVTDDEWAAYAPDLLVTLGGHITSKRLKQLLRKHPAACHWDIRPDATVKDTFQSITGLICAEPADFLNSLSEALAGEDNMSCDSYASLWHKQSEIAETKTGDYLQSLPFSDIAAIRLFMNRLPQNTALHLSNSSPIRNAQLFGLPPRIEVYSNRGTNGIDGVVSTAVGSAATRKKPVFLMIGDLSFFYDINGLWNEYAARGLRILLLNNGGGNMFRLINGPEQSPALEHYIACAHSQSAKERVTAFGLHYLSATDTEELHQALERFCDLSDDTSMVLEVFTQAEINTQVFRHLFETLKER